MKWIYVYSPDDTEMVNPTRIGVIDNINKPERVVTAEGKAYRKCVLIPVYEMLNEDFKPKEGLLPITVLESRTKKVKLDNLPKADELSPKLRKRIREIGSKWYNE